MRSVILTYAGMLQSILRAEQARDYCCIRHMNQKSLNLRSAGNASAEHGRSEILPHVASSQRGWEARLCGNSTSGPLRAGNTAYVNYLHLHLHLHMTAAGGRAVIARLLSGRL